MKKKAAALSLALLSSIVGVQSEVQEEVELQDEAPMAQEEKAPAPEMIPLTYANIDKLCDKNNGLVFTLTWMKGEEADAVVWKDMLDKIVDVYQNADKATPDFKDALGLVTSFDPSIPCQGNISLTLESLDKDMAIRRTKKEDIDFDGIVAQSTGLQFVVKMNKEDYTEAGWKRVMTRLVELAELTQKDQQDAELSAQRVLESLDEVELKEEN